MTEDPRRKQRAVQRLGAVAFVFGPVRLAELVEAVADLREDFFEAQRRFGALWGSGWGEKRTKHFDDLADERCRHSLSAVGLNRKESKCMVRGPSLLRRFARDLPPYADLDREE